jgi:pyruvate-ferredoxin/flavodoxin oxidoreductase
MNTTRLEKRKVCSLVPVWTPDKCSQCNYCSIVCPHAVVRPFLLTNEELEKAPKGYKSVKAKGKELAGLNWGI